MNDRQRYEFAGHPERCIKCGAKFKTSNVATSTRGVWRNRVWCPNYGKATSASFLPFSQMKIGEYSGSGFGHEWYDWFSDEPSLPGFLQPLRVGDASPYLRSAIYATIVFMALIAIGLILGLGSAS